MTYPSIKQKVYDYLWPVSQEDAVRVGYSDKIYSIFNEATFRLAHTIMPDIRVYKIKISRDKLPARVTLPPNFISFCNDQDSYANGQAFVLNKAGYRDVILDGTEYRGFKTDIEYHIYYNAAYPEVINGGQYFKVLTVSDNPPVNEDNWKYENISTDSDYELPDIIGNLVPHYIVGQLLSQDDKVRSIEELNTFETLLATVNVDRNARQREYRSSRGWY